LREVSPHKVYTNRFMALPSFGVKEDPPLAVPAPAAFIAQQGVQLLVVDVAALAALVRVLILAVQALPMAVLGKPPFLQFNI
jgi:hypothetical protein